MALDKKYDRRTSIGASEAAAVLEVNHFTRARDVWLEKIGPRITGITDSIHANAGNLLEPEVVKAYVERTGAPLVRAKTTRHPVWQFLSATPDRLSKDGRTGVEVKMVFSKRSWSAWANGAHPFTYEIQCRHSLRVFPSVERWILVGCFGSLNTTASNPNGSPAVQPETLQIRIIERRDLVDRFIEASEALWWINHIDRGIPVEETYRAAGFEEAFRKRLDALTETDIEMAESRLQTIAKKFHGRPK